MKRGSIKETFGGEVTFTKFIASDFETSNRLLTSVDLSDEDGYSVVAEEHTQDSKRVDLVVRNSDGEIILVIESQDSTGWLDSVHASKITYYMYDKRCEDGILLTEDASEHVKNYIRYINENTSWNIWLIATVVYENNSGKYVDFVPLIRPSSITDKRVKRVGSGSAQTTFQDDLARIAEENPGLFTNQAKYWNSTNDVAGTGINVSFAMNNSSYRVSLFHNGRLANDAEFKNSVTAFAKRNGYESRSRKDSEYIAVADESTALNVFKLVVDALKNKEIYTS